MSWTKRELIEEAFDAAGLSAYVFNLKPEDYRSALRKMDSMMANWHAAGIDLAWPMTASPDDSQLDEETNLPDWAIEAVYANLARKLAPAFGKKISTELHATANSSYNRLLIYFSKPRERQLPETMARGSGNKPGLVTRRFFPEPQEDPQPWEK